MRPRSRGWRLEYIYGYRVMLISGGGALILADSLDWFWVYLAMAACVGVGVVTVLLSRAGRLGLRRHAGRPHRRATNRPLAIGGVVAPFVNSPAGRQAAILLFIVFYKFCDAFAGIMATLYLQIGFSRPRSG